MEADGRYHLRHVTGPDEYHEDVDDNAHTNSHGSNGIWSRASRWPGFSRENAGPSLASTGSRGLGLTLGEIESSERLAAAYGTPVSIQKRASSEQFQGLLRPGRGSTWRALEPRHDGGGRAPRAGAISQRSKVPPAGRCRHGGSTCSGTDSPPTCAKPISGITSREPDTAAHSAPAIHALVAARLGDLELAGRYFRQTAAIPT